mgnify:FL=1
MFVTAKKSVVPHISVNPPEIGSSGASSAAAEDERDILEEDLNDLNYIPYPKIGAGRGKRGRPPKSQ